MIRISCKLYNITMLYRKKKRKEPNNDVIVSSIVRVHGIIFASELYNDCVIVYYYITILYCQLHIP